MKIKLNAYTDSLAGYRVIYPLPTLTIEDNLWWAGTKSQIYYKSIIFVISWIRWRMQIQFKWDIPEYKPVIVKQSNEKESQLIDCSIDSLEAKYKEDINYFGNDS